MKKIILFIVLVLFAPLCVMAEENHVYSINMNIYIDDQGTAHISEIWEVQAERGHDWCKIFSNLENVELEDISVLMDEELYENEDEGTSSSKAHYDLKFVTGGKQLCFGYNDTKKHNFMLEYEIKDYVLTTGDSQVLYHVLAENVTADMFFADIVTYYMFPDDLDLRAPGFVGNAYVDNGRIVIANLDGIENQYVTVLAKLPLGTFPNTSKDKDIKSFEDALSHSENEKYKYFDYTRRNSKFTFIDFIFVLLSVFVVLLIVEFIVRKVTGKSMFANEKIKRLLDKIKKIFGKLGRIIKNKIGKKRNNNM